MSEIEVKPKGGFLPSVRTVSIDLADYGGEGTIVVRGMTAKESAWGIAKSEAGTEMVSDEFLEVLRRCVISAPPDGEPIDKEVFEMLPSALFDRIASAIEEASEFPLAQKDGEE